MQRVTYRNLRLDIGTRQELRAALRALLVSSPPSRVVTVNPEYVVLARTRPELVELTRTATLNLVDGVGLAWALRRQGRADRYPGADAVVDLCRELAVNREHVGILVPANSLSTPGVIHERFEQAFPGLQCSVWVLSPEVVEQIKRTKPRVLFVTLGQPQQDLWSAEHAAKLEGTALVMGVGGAIDFVTGARRRAPRFLRQLGLEWLWRLVTQPWRLPRIFRATFGFWYTILFR